MPAPQKLRKGDCDAITRHLRAIGRIPLLTADEEISLGRAVQSGRRLLEAAEEFKLRSGGQTPSEQDWAASVNLTPRQLRRELKLAERACERMVTANLRLVVSLARRISHRRLDLEDLIQEGTLGLMRAVQRFDPSRGYKFSTYATWWIREGMGRALQQQSRSIRLPAHMQDRLLRLRRCQMELRQMLGREPNLEELAEATELKPLDLREALFKNPSASTAAMALRRTCGCSTPCAAAPSSPAINSPLPTCKPTWWPCSMSYPRRKRSCCGCVTALTNPLR
jgi:RNA polymerase nonessential primary-like sigma factor